MQGLGSVDEDVEGHEDDHISALSFDKHGDYVSFGDSLGRVVIFKYMDQGDPESISEDGKKQACL